LIPPRAFSPGSTDDADGTDGVFGPRTYRDHTGPQSAFTRERDLDAQRPQERLQADNRPTASRCSYSGSLSVGAAGARSLPPRPCPPAGGFRRSSQTSQSSKN
jgi:hypothetical protein